MMYIKGKTSVNEWIRSCSEQANIFKSELPSRDSNIIIFNLNILFFPPKYLYTPPVVSWLKIKEQAYSYKRFN